MSHGAGHSIEWLAYLAGASLTLGYKYGAYHYASYRAWAAAEKAKQGVERTDQITAEWSWPKTTAQWFFENSSQNAASWFATIGVVWMLGAMYIERIDWLFSEMTSKVPLHASFAFTLGCINEMAAPEVVKWLVAKVVPKAAP